MNSALYCVSMVQSCLLAFHYKLIDFLYMPKCHLSLVQQMSLNFLVFKAKAFVRMNRMTSVLSSYQFFLLPFPATKMVKE